MCKSDSNAILKTSQWATAELWLSESVSLCKTLHIQIYWMFNVAFTWKDDGRVKQIFINNHTIAH